MNSVNIKFVCRKCGGHELGYQKYAKCTSPVSMRNDGHIEYDQSIIDEEDSLATLNGFRCQSCGILVEHCGTRLETEKELIDYLKMEPYDRLHQQQEYEDLLDAQMSAQEQSQKELSDMAIAMEME